MSEQSKPRPLWIKATGHQCGDQLCGDNYPESEHDISEDDRWIYTFVQTVDPGTNSVAMKNKWLKVIEANPKTLAAEEMFDALEKVGCDCSVRERDSGHITECFMPYVIEAINKARGE